MASTIAPASRSQAARRLEATIAIRVRLFGRRALTCAY